MIYIYIYIEREREREYRTLLNILKKENNKKKSFSLRFFGVDYGFSTKLVKVGHKHKTVSPSL